MITKEQLDELERLRDEVRTAPFPRDSDWCVKYYEALSDYMPKLIAAARENVELRKALENYNLSVDWVLKNPGRDFYSVTQENAELRKRVSELEYEKKLAIENHAWTSKEKTK